MASAVASKPTLAECGAWLQPVVSAALQVAPLKTDTALGALGPLGPLGGIVVT